MAGSCRLDSRDREMIRGKVRALSDADGRQTPELKLTFRRGEQYCSDTAQRFRVKSARHLFQAETFRGKAMFDSFSVIRRCSGIIRTGY